MILTDSFANVCNIVFNLRSLTCLGTTRIFPAGEHPAPQQLGCRENLRNLRLKKTWRSWRYIYIRIYIHTYIYNYALIYRSRDDDGLNFIRKAPEGLV